jgi:hypothetical protein
VYDIIGICRFRKGMANSDRWSTYIPGQVYWLTVQAGAQAFPLHLQLMYLCCEEHIKVKGIFLIQNIPVGVLITSVCLFNSSNHTQQAILACYV